MRNLVSTLTVSVASLGLAVPALAATTYQFQAGVSNGLVADTGYATNDAHVQPNGGQADANFNTGFIRVKTGPNDPVFGVLGFNIAATSGITVASASLTLTVQYAGDVNGSTHDLYNLPSGNTSWLETTATSNFQTGTTKWKNGTGADSSQLQYAVGANELLDTTGLINFTANQTVTFDIAASVAQAWVDNPASFTGLVIKQSAGNDQFYYYSGEAATLSTRPLLKIVAVPEPSAFALVFGSLGMLFFRRRRAN